MAIERAVADGVGQAKVNYRMRDAVFSRQRYWGEPVPVYFKDNIPYLIDESDLPLELPEVDEYLPTENGEPPLGRATDWQYQGQIPLRAHHHARLGRVELVPVSLHGPAQ